MIRTLKEYPSRIWLLDNSGSMETNDGEVYVPDKKRYLSCTRWVELKDTVKFHLKLAVGLEAPCVLQLLNPGHEGKQFMSCSNSCYPRIFRQQVSATWRTIERSHPQSKRSRTPLTEYIYQIHARIVDEADRLCAKGQRICIILVTDGLPSDNPYGAHGGPREAFRQALNSLCRLPVWVVVRLATDEETVVEYYNDLDQQVAYCHVVVLRAWTSISMRAFCTAATNTSNHTTHPHPRWTCLWTCWTIGRARRAKCTRVTLGSITLSSFTMHERWACGTQC